MRNHQDMLKRGKVSIWVGNIRSEDELLSYVDDGGFGRDFDFEVNPRFGRELKAEPQPVPLKQLAEGFSSWRMFIDSCVKRGMETGLTTATCMAILYAFEYKPSAKVNMRAPLTYLGSFDF